MLAPRFALGDFQQRIQMKSIPAGKKTLRCFYSQFPPILRKEIFLVLNHQALKLEYPVNGLRWNNSIIELRSVPSKTI